VSPESKAISPTSRLARLAASVDHGAMSDELERSAEGDYFRDRCGVVGIFAHPEAAKLVYLGLRALQHRGQDSAGIVSSQDKSLTGHRAMGLVADGFSESILTSLSGPMAIGHVRYSTAGGSQLKNAQPFIADYAGGSLAVAHNGNLVNALSLRKVLEREGRLFQSTMDTEVLMHLVARSEATSLEERIVDALAQVQGAYSLLFLAPGVMIGARDPLGFRPLVLGRLGKGYVLASESCALDLIEASLVREVEPGELVILDERTPEELRSIKPRRLHSKRHGSCIFEQVYFARPDSVVFGQSVWKARRAMGSQLATEHPAKADLVIPVPDSGVPAALGYSEVSGIPFDLGLVRSHYVGRTFIEPTESIRNFGVKLKLSPIRAALSGKRVVVVDDSLVRGTTSRKIVSMLRAAGALEVHLRVASPPTTDPCYFGIDTPTKSELIASSHGVEEIAAFVGADSLGYLSVEGLHHAVDSQGDKYCDGCFTGRYLLAPSLAVEDSPASLDVVA